MLEMLLVAPEKCKELKFVPPVFTCMNHALSQLGATQSFTFQVQEGFDYHSSLSKGPT